MRIENFPDGFAICADGSDPGVHDLILHFTGEWIPLVVTDPPYGRVVSEAWDKTKLTQGEFAEWLIGWTRSIERFMLPGAAAYVWGGYGVPGFRPFFEYLSRVEDETSFQLANFITWGKRRAYGVQNNYLATREELAFLILGNAKKPRRFNVPHLEAKRGYAGYNPKYPARSEFLRRTSVWTDVTELFSGKVHPTQKPVRLYEIPIEVHTEPNEWIVDLFAGSMTAAHAARKTERRWVCVERDPDIFDRAVAEIKSGKVRK